MRISFCGTSFGISASALIISLATCATPGAASGAKTSLQILDFHSIIFASDRKLRVLLPPGYDDPKNRLLRYPVLYLNDGQDLFEDATPTFASFHSTSWQVQERMDRLYDAGSIAPLIIVGIDNAGRHGRPDEYLPWPDVFLRPPLPKPHGSKYPSFLLDEVEPLIQSHFRVLDDAAMTGIGGASYGAEIAAYAAFVTPRTFGRLLLESPSVYVDDYHILRTVAAARWLPAKVYIGVGTNEDNASVCPATGTQEEVDDVMKLKEALDQAGLSDPRLDVVVQKCGTHTPLSWGDRFSAAMQFLYGQ